MKKSLFIVVLCVLLMSACNKTSEAAENVINLVNAVETAEDNESAITEAYIAYSQLTDEDKKSIPDEIRTELVEEYTNITLKQIVEELDLVWVGADYFTSLSKHYWKNEDTFNLLYDVDAMEKKINDWRTTEEFKETLENAVTIRNGKSSVLDKLKERLNNIDDIPDKYSSAYEDVKKLYTSVSSFADFALEYPVGYSSNTYNQACLDYKTEYTKLKNEVDLELH